MTELTLSNQEVIIRTEGKPTSVSVPNILPPCYDQNPSFSAQLFITQSPQFIGAIGTVIEACGVVKLLCNYSAFYAYMVGYPIGLCCPFDDCLPVDAGLLLCFTQG